MLNNDHEYSTWLPIVLSIAKKAALNILTFYSSLNHKPFDTYIKDDLSPVTSADMSAHHIIQEGLSAFMPNIPFISEEGKDVSFEERALWSRYWLIDPLDGTKEFIAHTGEFAVNIALIENHIPVLGVVVAPVLQESYWAVKGQPAYYQHKDEEPRALCVNSHVGDKLKVALSRRHHDDMLSLHSFLKILSERYAHKNPLKFIYCGSALKICLVASGKADIYPRLGRTGEWDTAAGQCILEAAGGIICDDNGEMLKYNLKKSLMNNAFIAFGPNELSNIFCG